MSRTAHILDIIVRSFFMFVVFWLVLSYIFRSFLLVLLLSVAVTSGINLIFELTAGKKYWVKTADKKTKRKIKQVAKEFFVRAFSRDKTKGFVRVGLILLLMSFIVKLNIYYIIFACVIFVFAAITRFAPPQKCVTITSAENNSEKSPPDKGVGENPVETPASAQ